MTTTSVPLTNTSVDALRQRAQAEQEAASRAGSGSGSGGDSPAQLSQTFDDFLRLLTTQLRNQDPISPIDSTEFTNQLVLFSQVEQQIATNDKFDQLLALQGAGNFGDPIGYLDQEVEFVGNRFQFNGDPATVGYGMPGDIPAAVIEIRNASGTVVYVQEATTNFGRNEFVWDGRTISGGPALPGAYTFAIKANDADGEEVEIPTFVRGRVNGVENVEGTSILLVDNVPVNMGDVIAVRTPEPVIPEEAADDA